VIGELLVLVALVGCSAFFGASETAYLSLSRVTLRGLQKSKDAAEKRVQKLHQRLEHLLSTILLGTNLVNNLASSIATGLALGWAGSRFSAQYAGRVLTVVTLGMTVIIVMFSDILPKTIAAYRPLSVAKALSLPLTVLSRVFHPFVLIFSGLARGLTRLADKVSGENAGLITEEEINTLIEVGNQEGTVTRPEKDLLKRIIKFQDMRAENIMRHRSLVCSVSKNASFDDLVAALASRRYSQILVFEDIPDNYVGLVDYRDLLRGPGKFSMDEVIAARTLRFVPGTMSVATLLQTFRREGVHFAVVVDEHGGNQGVVTLKDVLHAVLGRIDRSTEHAEPAHVRILGSKAFSVPGALSLTECNEIFGFNLQSEFYDTLAGWVLGQFDALPETGDSFYRDGWEFTVEDVEERRIVRLGLRQE
jgi:putative hemolysin